MRPIHLEKQPPVEPLDEATKAAIEEGRAAIRRGETTSLEESAANARERYKAWKKNRQPTTLPA